jgi:membrane protein YdbS with pleckstrin-like domain
MVSIDHESMVFDRTVPDKQLRAWDCVIAVAIFVASGIVGALAVVGLLRSVAGPLPSFAGLAFVLVEVVVALFIAGALRAPGSSRNS